jgi:glycerophosphoryl diester phosphodiesterase
VGHRGNSAHAPENTLESFRQAVALGVDALEFDVRLTRDGEVVVIHDPTVARTTGASGIVDEMTLAELRRLDAGATFTTNGSRAFPYRGRGIGLSTLAEVLESFPAMPMLIEVKVAEAAQPARDVITDASAEARCIAASFSHEALIPFEEGGIAISSPPASIAPMCVPALMGRRYTSLSFQTMSLPRVFRGIPVPLRALARAAEPAGVPLHVWTVNDSSVALRLWRGGVRGILSDDPAEILRAREQWRAQPPDQRGR